MRHSQVEVAVKSLVVLWRSGSARTWSCYVLYSGKEEREDAAKPHSRGCLGLKGLVEARLHIETVSQDSIHEGYTQILIAKFNFFAVLSYYHIRSMKNIEESVVYKENNQETSFH